MPVPEKKLTPVVEPYDTTIAEAMDTQVHRERQVLAAEADIMAYSKMRK